MYEQHILQILSDVGKRGISVSLLAKHVYNMSSTLFSKPEFDDVLREVRNFVLRNTRSKKGLLEHTNHWGYYRLNSRGIAAARPQPSPEDESAGNGREVNTQQLSIDFSA